MIILTAIILVKAAWSEVLQSTADGPQGKLAGEYKNVRVGEFVGEESGSLNLTLHADGSVIRLFELSGCPTI